MQNAAPSMVVDYKSNNEREFNKRQEEGMILWAHKIPKVIHDKHNSSLMIRYGKKKWRGQQKALINSSHNKQ